MKEPVRFPFLLCLLFGFFIGGSVTSYAQLSNFTLTLTKSDETCSGNGILNFSVSGTSPNATIVYSIYLLPNTTNPIGVTSSNSITGLVAGNYRVVALQTLGNLSNSKQQDVQIVSLINPLSYQVSGDPIDCINGNITVTVTNGNPATYEIIAGPQIIAPQTSNVFAGLGVGEYVIRVNDVCGDGIVQTFTLTGATALTISAIEQLCNPESCLSTAGFIKISPAIGSTIYYPLQVETTIIPPNGGTPVVSTQTITSGTIPTPPNLPFAIANLSLPIAPYLHYSYTIKVTDACGGNFMYNGSDLVRIHAVELLTFEGDSEAFSFISIKTCNLLPPFTVSILEAPAGFNPSLFNSGHPGPFLSSPIIYQSTAENQLPLGDYDIQVTDSCGVVDHGICTLGGCLVDYSARPVCSTFGLVKFRFISELIITAAPAGFPFPLPYDCTSQIIDNQFIIQLPLGNYTFTGFSSCNEPFELYRSLDLPTYTISAENQDGCESNTGTIHIKYAQIGLELAIVGVRILSAPVAFSFPLPFNANQFIVLPISKIEVEITGLPPGDYTLEVTDFCGNIYPLSVTVPVTISVAVPTYSVLNGCTDGFGSVFIDTPNRRFTQVIMTAAPATYSQSLPFDVTFNVSPQGKFYMNELPEGNYTFSTVDVCGVSNTFAVIIPGYHVLQSEVTVVGNCGSFDLAINHSIAQPYSQIFWLQKLDTNTNQWKHPYSGVVFNSGDLPNAENSYQVYNFATNFNFAINGKFRVVKVNSVYSNGSATLANCEMVVIKEFEFTGELKIVNATKVLCADGGYNAFITVAGIPPFTYKITTKDGQPFVVDNGNSNYFSNLSEGTYNFQIQDFCGNIINRVYDIATLLEPTITQSRLCDGQNGKLIAPEISFLSYQWWNGSAPDVILSTTNTLDFNPFLSSTAAGTYFVRIYSTSSLSCLDKTLSYTIPQFSNPKAGNDGSYSVCGTTNSVNLFTMLSGNFETTGNWIEITNSGLLSGATWVPTNSTVGVYQFKYVVNGFCDDFDDALITINLKEIPETPIFVNSSDFCFNQPFQLSVNPIQNASFEWIGPNGFISNLQNVVLSNPSAENVGLYTVTANLDGCLSTNFVTLSGHSVPAYEIQHRCILGAYKVEVVPSEGSFLADGVAYHWTGPNDFSSALNPIDITGFSSGLYTVAVTNSEGCSLSKTVQIGNTFCGTIPVGVSPNGDGKNETFDLTGFGTDIKFKIFNRYGTMVFEQDNYTNQWYGQDYNGHQLPDATYFYYIRLKSGEEKTGWVYVTK